MTWNKDRKQTKYGHMWHMTHTTEDWHYSPLPKGSSRALTVPSGRGGGRSGGPSGQTRTGTQDGDLQSGTDRQGPWRSWELWKPWRCRELRWPWQVVLQPEPFYPPQNFPGEVRGYKEPSGAKQTNRTGHPTGTASTSTTRGQAAIMASMATIRGAACPRWVSVDKTGQDKEGFKVQGSRKVKMFLWAQHNLKTALLAVTGGLDPRG